MQVDGNIITNNTPVLYNGVLLHQLKARNGTGESYKPMYVWIPFTTMPADEHSLTYYETHPASPFKWEFRGDESGKFQGNYTPSASFNCEDWDGSQSFIDTHGTQWVINGSYSKTSWGTLMLNGGSLQVKSIQKPGSGNVRVVKIVMIPDWGLAPRFYASTSNVKYYTIYSSMGAKQPSPDWALRYSGKDVMIGQGNSSSVYNSGSWHIRAHRRASRLNNTSNYLSWYSNWWYDSQQAIGSGSQFVDDLAAGSNPSWCTFVIRDGFGVNGTGLAMSTMEHNTGGVNRQMDYAVGELSEGSGSNYSEPTYYEQSTVDLVFGGAMLNTYGNDRRLEELYGQIAQIVVWGNVPEGQWYSDSAAQYFGLKVISEAHGRYQQCRNHERRINNNYWG